MFRMSFVKGGYSRLLPVVRQAMAMQYAGGHALRPFAISKNAVLVAALSTPSRDPFPVKLLN